MLFMVIEKASWRVNKMHSLITILFSVLLLSCKNDNKSTIVVKQDTVANERKLRDEKLTLTLNTLSSKMALPVFRESEFELRLWVNTVVESNMLILINIQKDILVAKKILYKIDQNQVLLYKHKEIKNIDSLKEKLNDLQFKNFISQKEIIGFKDNIADGVTYHLQIADHGYYNVVTYHCPDSFAKHDKYNAAFYKFIMMLDKYFTFYSPMCKPA